MSDGETFEDTADFLINGTGILNAWKWPDVPALKEFEGTLVHTARYPQDLDLRDKRVGIIGVGSTSVQVIPTIQPGQFYRSSSLLCRF